LGTFGIDAAGFVAAIDPTFARLPWDMYDVRRTHIAQLMAHCPASLQPSNRQLLKQYYLGQVGAEVFDPWRVLMTAEQKNAWRDGHPCRRRAVSSYQLTLAPDGAPALTRAPVPEFCQAEVEDYRQWPRVFAPMSLSPDSSAEFRAFLLGVGRMVVDVRPMTRSMRLTVHQVSTIAYDGRPGMPAPEGIHQDGADYIVSALVVSRRGVIGAVSQLFLDDRTHPVFSLTLTQGVGLFHADARSTIWHNATPIVAADQHGSSTGIRNVLGVDVHLDHVEQSPTPGA
jgi:hypothetical protein